MAGAAAVVQVLIGASPRRCCRLDRRLARRGGRCRRAQAARRAAARRDRDRRPAVRAAPVFLAGWSRASRSRRRRFSRARRGARGPSAVERVAPRLLRVLGDRLGDGCARPDDVTSIAPEQMLLAADADRAGRGAMDIARRQVRVAHRVAPVVHTTHREHDSVRDRWRMILGTSAADEAALVRAVRAGRRCTAAGTAGLAGRSRAAAAARTTVPAVRAADRGRCSARVFGGGAKAAPRAGRRSAPADPAPVAPSVELLERVLSLKGGSARGARPARADPPRRRRARARARGARATGDAGRDQPARDAPPDEHAASGEDGRREPVARARRWRRRLDHPGAAVLQTEEPPSHGLEHRARRRRVRIDGAVGDLQRDDGRDPVRGAVDRRTLPRVLDGDHRSQRARVGSARAVARGTGRRRHAHREGAALREEPRASRSARS